ncbi:G-protein coupled receptor 54-like [Amphiura filiformis]|uniref:G-protein coupled receptor 54-like n=1 Tax=Amphiura filiformis TaxID=82378 RepID=UPI003B21B34F
MESESSYSSFNSSYQNATFVDPRGPEAVIMPIIMVVIAIIAVVGNGLVVYIVLRFRNMRQSVTNFYIMNVAVSDLVFVLVCVPLTASLYATVEWKLGAFLCKLNAYLQPVAVQATCATLTVMTVDRYYVIMSPFASRRTRTTCRAAIICCIIWILSALLHIPSAFFYNVEKSYHTNIETKHCFLDTSNEMRLKIYFTYLTLTTFLIPLVIIGVCYILILMHLWSLTIRNEFDDGNSVKVRSGFMPAAQSPARSASKTWKTTRIVLIIVLLFALCWAPIHVINLWRVLSRHYPDSLFNFQMFALALSYCNSCINPAVYALAGASYKNHLWKMLTGKPHKPSHGQITCPSATASSMYRNTGRRNSNSKTEATNMSVSTCV